MLSCLCSLQMCIYFYGYVINTKLRAHFEYNRLVAATDVQPVQQPLFAVSFFEVFMRMSYWVQFKLGAVTSKDI